MVVGIATGLLLLTPLPAPLPGDVQPQSQAHDMSHVALPHAETARPLDLKPPADLLLANRPVLSLCMSLLVETMPLPVLGLLPDPLINTSRAPRPHMSLHRWTPSTAAPHQTTAISRLQAAMQQKAARMFSASCVWDGGTRLHDVAARTQTATNVAALGTLRGPALTRLCVRVAQTTE